jgi:hypothetical protein
METYTPSFLIFYTADKGRLLSSNLSRFDCQRLDEVFLLDAKKCCFDNRYDRLNSQDIRVRKGRRAGALPR